MQAVVAPLINPNDEEVQINQWFVKDGDFVNVGTELAEIETTKTTSVVEATSEGVFTSVVCEGSIVNVGATLGFIDDGADSSVARAVESTKDSSAVDARETDLSAIEERLRIVRLSRKAEILIAEEPAIGDRLKSMKGLVIASDLDNGRRSGVEDDIKPVTYREEPLPLAKRNEIRALEIGQEGSVNSNLAIQFDIEKDQCDCLMTISATIIKNLPEVLEEFPELNAFYLNQSIRFFDVVKIGYAVDLGAGIRLYNIENAAEKSVENISAEILMAAINYGKGDFSNFNQPGSTITVTDLAGQNVLNFHPLINGHQACVVGIGAISHSQGSTVALICTFDHRCSTGRRVAEFLNSLKDRVIRCLTKSESHQ